MNTKYAIIENYKSSEDDRKTIYLHQWIKIIKSEIKLQNLEKEVDPELEG